MDKKSRALIEEQHSKLFAEYGCDMRSLVAPNTRYDKRHQHLKFSVAARYIRKNDSVLDVGCGLSDLYFYLKEQGWQGKYAGIDFCEEFLEAGKERIPDGEFLKVDILEEKLRGDYDHVVCIATLQQKPPFEDPDTYLKAMVSEMFAIANKTVIFDVFSNKFADFFNPGSMYSDPAELCEFCYSLTNRLAMVNDYNPYQLMMILRKPKLNGWIDLDKEQY